MSQLCVAVDMEIFGCMEGVVLTKEGCRYVSIKCGEQSVMIAGAILMLVWYAHSLDTPELVLSKLISSAKLYCSV